MSVSDILGPVDSAFLYADTPDTPMNIGGVTIFEGQIDFDLLIKLIDARIHEIPLYQKLLVQTPINLGPPMWAYDPDFFIGNHVFRLKLDSPGTEEQLRQLAGHLISGQLDRSKPLWEVYMIEGLEGDRTALVFKIHHCMVDGLAAVEIFTLLLDLTPNINIPEKPLFDPPAALKPGDLIARSLRTDVPHKLGVLNKLGRDLAHLGSIFADKEKRRKALVGVANLINDNLRPIRKLPINGTNTGKMTVAWAEFSLAEVRAIKSNRRSSVNDVMLSVLAGAIANYTRAHDPHNPQDFFRVLVPVNMRVENERNAFGNRISVLPVDVPLNIQDPLERLDAVTRYSTIMKESSLSNSLDMLLTLPSLAPAITQPFIWKLAPTAFSILAHSWCTNVAGPQIPMYMLGHQMLHTYGYFPLNPSMGLSCVVMSYNQRITMTLVADAGIVPNVNEVKNYLESSYRALRLAAKIQEIEPVKLSQSRIEPDISPTPIMESEPEVIVVEEIVTAATVNGHKPVVTVENMVVSPTIELAPQNAETVETLSPIQTTTIPPPEPPKLFSEAWAQSYKSAINNNPDYHRVSTRWDAGSLAFVMKSSPQNGYPYATAVLMDLHKGECRAARSLPATEALSKAAFVIEGDYPSWIKVLRGEAQPLGMIMRGKLRLTKGSLARLLPFTQSAQELVHSAQLISRKPT